MAKKFSGIGPLEMEVLGALNAATDRSVHDIRAELKSSGRPLAYTTVMTVLARLYEKNLALRRKEGRSYLYSAATRRGSAPAGIFEKVKNSLFGSERLAPILGLLDGEDSLSRTELEELKRAVEARLKKP